MPAIHDLEHRFTVGGRSYHVHIVVDDPRPRPVVIANNDFDVAVFACAKGDLSDFDCDEPHNLALRVVEGVVKFMPTKPTPEELDEFHEAALDWIMRHRGAAALAAHAEE